MYSYLFISRLINILHSNYQMFLFIPVKFVKYEWIKKNHGCFIYLHILLQIKLNILLIILAVSSRNSNSYNWESTSTVKNTTDK